jgi:hypothetical protein
MLEQLFEKIESELLTDEVKLEMTTLFESAMNEAAAKKEEALEEQNKADIAEFKDELVGKLDEYLTYFVEEFTRENEQQIEDAVKVKTAQRVLDVFEGVVVDFNLKLDDTVIADSEELDEAKTTINDQTEEILSLRTKVTGLESSKIIEGMVSAFETDSEKEKFRQLAETISFTDSEEYAQKLGIISESVKTPAEPVKPLEEDLDDTVDPEDPPAVDEKMAGYLSCL